MNDCPRCGVPLPADTASCPRCLLELGLAGKSGESRALSNAEATLSFGSAPTLDAPSEVDSVLAPARSFEAGSRLGAFRLVRLLGRGGFGEVWEAEDERDGRRIALKLLSGALDAAARERFRREGRIAASIESARTVFVFSAEEEEGVPAIAMELLPGGDLKELVERDGALDWRDAVERLLELVEGLEAAEKRGILHRDIKPSNCFLDENGGAKIGDFGLSLPTEGDGDRSRSGEYVGTPAFSSPEQVRGVKLDVRSDLFSLGATFYYLLSGRAPFEGETLGQLLARVVADPPAPLGRHGVVLPNGLERVVLELLAKDPAERPQTYVALRTRLLPYSRRRLRAAELGRRVVAYALDLAILFALTSAARWLAGAAGLASSFARLTEQPLVALALGAALTLAYFTLFELRYGRTPGKAATGLAVRAAAGTPLAPAAALARSSAFLLCGWAAAVGVLFASPPAAGLLALVPLAIQWAPMRRRNGFRALHELVSGTRVTHEPLRFPGAALPSATSAQELSRRAAVGAPGARLGPYELGGRLRRDARGELWAGFDPQLRRALWIVRRPLAAVDEPELPPTPRPGALLKLQSGRDGEGGWDAYPALEGAGLTGWIGRSGARSWPETQRILTALARALDADPGRAQRLALDAVWITLELDVRLLPFVAPDAPAEEAPTTAAARDWQRFLFAAAVALLDGRLPVAGESAPALNRLLPFEYRAPLERLAASKYGSPKELEELLAELPALSTELSVARRGIALALAALPFSLLLGAALARTGGERFARFGAGPSTWLVLIVLPLSLSALLALVFPALLPGGGLSLWLARVRVVRRDGAPAGRWRAFARALVAWSPALVAAHSPLYTRQLATPLLLLFAAGVVYALLSPARGLQDRIAGTALVPKW
jgi:uncharacterized RDD family membrane protein YckC